MTMTDSRQRKWAETVVLALTVGAVGLSLTERREGLICEVGALLGIVVISGYLELCPLYEAGYTQPSGYKPRWAGSQGISVGALALPWTLAALSSAALGLGTNAGWPLFALRSAAAASAMTLAFLTRQPAGRTTCGPGLRCRQPGVFAQLHAVESAGQADLSQAGGRLAARQHSGCEASLPGCNNAPDGEHICTGNVRQALAWAPAAGCALVLCLVLASVLQGHEHSGHTPSGDWTAASGKGLALTARDPPKGTRIAAEAIGITLNATAATGSMHLMLLHLPACFTVGEALVVAQAITLLASDVLVLALSHASTYLSQHCSSSQQPWLSCCLLPDRSVTDGHSPAWLPYDGTQRSDIGLFVELLVFSALVFALLLIPLMRSLWPSDSPTADADTSQALSQPLITSHTTPAPQTQAGRWLKAGALAAVVLAAVLLAVRPALWVLQYASATTGRLAMLATWAALLAAALPIMDRMARSKRVPTIIVRKGYHVLAMALFLPALLLEPGLLAVSLGIAAAALVAVEVLRVGRCPVMGACIDSFMTAFIDSRDRGLLLVSHFSLLVGMAIPLWLSLQMLQPELNSDVFTERLRQDAGHAELAKGGWLHAHVPAGAFAGIVILGVADSAASAVGRRYGRHKLLQTHKSLEGTLGGICFTLLGWALLAAVICALQGQSMWGLAHGVGSVGWRQIAVAVVGSCCLEAVTTQLDNIFLPLHHFALLAL